MEHGKFKVLLEELHKDLEPDLRQKPLSVEGYEVQLRKLIEYVGHKAYENGKRGNEKNEDIIQTLLRKDNAFIQQKSDLITVYSRLHRLASKLSDTENRLSKFDLKERIRFFTFRVLTAIGIAAVVLGTAFVAHNLGIPLPLSGLKNVSS